MSLGGVTAEVDARAQGAPADAAESPVAVAEAAFREGAAHYQRGEYALAAQAFRRAQEASPHPDTRFNLARSLESAGDLAGALREWLAYRDELTAPEEVRAAEVRIAALRARPVEVFVASDPLEAEVTLDAESAPAGTTPLRVRLRPGAHVLIARRAGYRDRVQRVEVEVGSPLDLTLRLDPEARVTVPAPPAAPSADERIMNRRRGGLLGWFSGRVGATFGVAWPVQSMRFANGLDLTLFLRRIVALQLHVLRIEDAGSPFTVLGEVGWVYAADDIDLGLFLHAGALLDCAQACPEGTSDRELVAGATVRADVVVHPHIGVGLFARFSWLDLEITRSEALLSSLGFSVSLYL